MDKNNLNTCKNMIVELEENKTFEIDFSIISNYQKLWSISFSLKVSHSFRRIKLMRSESLSSAAIFERNVYKNV